jgi:hypothetical protein
MIANFFRIALRNLFKNKIFSFINIFGLALGIASSLLIVEYARYELSYDKFEANSSRIYRLQLDRYNDGKLSTRWAAGATGLGPAVKDALPEVESFARLSNTGGIMSYKDRQFRESRCTSPTRTSCRCSPTPQWQAPQRRTERRIQRRDHRIHRPQIFRHRTRAGKDAQPEQKRQLPRHRCRQRSSPQYPPEIRHPPVLGYPGAMGRP